MSSKKKGVQVYLDFMVGSKPLGRVVFELFTDLTPKTAENFRGLCTGDYGSSGLSGRNAKLCYENCKIHRIVDNFCIQGGDITNGDGTGGFSIYGRHFADEDLSRRHTCAGLLSMANSGRNTNSSQFFITLKAAPHLDGKHVVFGQVIDGMDIVRQIAKVPVDLNDKPKIPVLIRQCGEVGDKRAFLRDDPFSKQSYEEIQQRKAQAEELRRQGVDPEEYFKKLDEKEAQVNEIDESLKVLQQLEEKINQVKEKPITEMNESTIKEDVIVSDKSKLNEKQKDRLREIRLKLNEAKKLNSLAVLEEEKRAVDPYYEKNKKKEIIKEKAQKKQDELIKKGFEKNQQYMEQSAIKQEIFQGKEKKNTTDNFGWNVFNTDTLYGAYEKRCKNLVFNEEQYKQQVENPHQEFQPTEESLQRLQQDMEQQKAKKKEFSRRRGFDEQNIDFIDERNRVFNNKIKRHFSEYTKEIKANLERGTAL
ncbi:hypothetical protein ABPG74_016845 [Tetrahymena malaccensis]